MKKISLFSTTAFVLSFFVNSAWAHFGTIVPSDDIVTQEDSKTIGLEVKFIHPMELHYMEMAKPKQFGVVHDGKKQDLSATLQAAKKKSSDQKEAFTFWNADYPIRRPGDYTFFVEPTPYWEPAEDCFIVHYTKVCVNALGWKRAGISPWALRPRSCP